MKREKRQPRRSIRNSGYQVWLAQVIETLNDFDRNLWNTEVPAYQKMSLYNAGANSTMISEICAKAEAQRVYREWLCVGDPF